MPNPTPLLFTYLFGEAAPVACQGASPRLLLWASAFDAWLEELLRRFKPSTVQQYRLAWQRLLAHTQKLPWELTQAGLQAHLAWLEGEGYSPFTVYYSLRHFSAFYRWCSLHAVDPECPPAFNPAAGVSIPLPRRYAGVKLLSRDGVRLLLEALRQDESPIGRRNYAFILARLRLGVPTRQILNLRWGQLEVREGGVRLRWREGAAPLRLPDEVWEALQSYLAASGRLALMPHVPMSSSACIFAPLVGPSRTQVGDRASDWLEGKAVTPHEIARGLKCYAALVHLPREALSLEGLRLIALRLKLDEGCSLEELRVFMDSRSPLKALKYCLKNLPELPPDVNVGPVGQAVSLSLSPSHKQYIYQPGDGYKHGLYAHSQPPERVKALLAENIQGIDEALAGLRLLGRGLLERHAQAASASAMARLGDAYTLAASRLAEMLKAEKAMAQGKSGSREKAASLDDFLDAVVRFEAEQGRPTTRAAVLADLEAEALGAGAEQGLAAHRLEEEIAATRLVLRNTLALALQAGEADEYIHLVDIYSSGCSRLVRMLQRGHASQDQLINYVREQILLAITEVSKGWKL